MCYDIKYLQLYGGKRPFKDWIDKLSKKDRLIIRGYIDRVSRGGGKKSIKNLGDGIFEIKIKYGPGYRLYFAIQGRNIILIINGGHKGSQKRDISLAKKYWSIYVSN